MSSAIDKQDLLQSLERLLEENKTEIFEENGNDLRVCGLSLSRRLRRREDRYHQILTIRYASNHRSGTKQIWLKYRPDFKRLFKIHADVYQQLRNYEPFVPKPYFYGEWHRTSLIGMELVQGVSLRNLLLRQAVVRRTETLEGIFLRMGTGMRLFHDSSPASGCQLVSELAAPTCKAAASTNYLKEPEKRQLIRCIEEAEQNAGSQTLLPLIKIHNDWVLRNILIGAGGAFYVVDLDSMRAPNNSRWYDIAYFLINLESQLKYRPVIGRPSLARLWKSFWQGYIESGLPDGLKGSQVASLIYLIKVRYLLGATIRPPLFQIYGRLLGPRYLRELQRSILKGECSTLMPEA